MNVSFDGSKSPMGSFLRFMPRVFSRTRVNALEKLLKTVKADHPRTDLAVIEQAYVVADRAHAGQMRRSGEPYITHPLAVAQILADLHVAPKVVAAGLLHDTVEDTDYTLEQLEADFGPEIALLVDGVTKLDKIKYGDATQAETVRKMIIAMTKDIRVLVIKLADRLHNARTWEFMPVEKAQAKARETLEIYAPLAHRLSIKPLKTELEDLSFRVLDPKLYHEIESLVSQHNPKREEIVQNISERIRADLARHKVRAEVMGRPKELYSIYQKMVVKGKSFNEIYDLIGIRILVHTEADCYKALGIVHNRWVPIPGRFKDYISMPKFNLYQSLHTTVLGNQGGPIEGKAFEVQIRTYEMHERAEYGAAAHWRYKQGGSASGGSGRQEVSWLQRIHEWQADVSDSQEFLNAFREEVGAKELYVFTPQGRMIGLPKGGTALDFAYLVHTEVGHKAIGVKVNSALVPLDAELQNGDIVEVITSKDPSAGPKQDWLKFVKSKRAQTKIRQWFTKERREEASELGSEELSKALRKQKFPLKKLAHSDLLKEVALQLHYESVSILYAAIGERKVSAQSVVEKLQQALARAESIDTASIPVVPARGGKHGGYAESSETGGVSFQRARSRQQRVDRGSNDCGVVVEGGADILTKLARCCTPMAGDQIRGFVTRGSGVSVHRVECKNFETMLDQQPDRVIDVHWAENSRALYLVHIRVEAFDRAGLLSEVTRVLSEHKVSILSAVVHTPSTDCAISEYMFEIADQSHLASVFAAIRKIDGVYNVYRVQTA